MLVKKDARFSRISVFTHLRLFTTFRDKFLPDRISPHPLDKLKIG